MTVPTASGPLADLSAAGVSIWLDDLSRELLAGGELGKLISEKHVVGVTTNPTIFASALSKGDRYSEQLGRLGDQRASVDDAVFALTTDDVRAGCDIFGPVHQRTGGWDGRVSIEVDPRLAQDADATIDQARRLWEAVDRPNLFVKIPATRKGLAAITTAIAEGISVNVTLIFSLDRYRDVMDAYQSGLEKPRPQDATCHTLIRSPRSSSPASTPRSTAASTPSPPPRLRLSRARPQSRTPGSPTRHTSR
jgi:transaldolase